MDAGHRGAAAIKAKDFPTAITELTTAIRSSPTSPLYHIQRSTAYQKTHDYSSALVDASRAVIYAHQRQKRELIAQAQLRRAIPLFFLERYGDAGKCLEWSERMYGEGKEKMVGIWKTQVNGKTKGLDAGDEKLVVSVREVPIWEEIEGSSGANGAQATAVNGDVTSGANGAGTTVAGSAKDAQTQPTSSQPQPAQPQITPASKIRHDWYQTTSHITLTILVKNAPKDTTSITIQPTSVGISIPITASSSYELSLDPLFASIVPEGSKYRTLGTKIEITLEKGEKGVKWHALEAAEPTFSENTMQDHNGQNVKGGVKDPYTHKAGKTAVNWDAVGRKPPKKGAEKGEKASMSDAGDASAEKEKPQVEEIDDDEFECSPSIKPTDTTTNESSTPANTTAKNGSTKTSPTEDNPDEYYDSEEESSGDPNYFFKKLFAGADDNVKKAMMKSYQESGGTALSTNWEDVSKGRVPVEPPEGMEAREWEGARSKRGKR